ncbi:MAG: OmpH family outer membrane protein [Agarilytica sp.]
MIKKTLLAVALIALAQVSFAAKIVVFDTNESIMRTQFAQQTLEAFESTPEFAKMKADYEGLTADLEILDKERSSKSMTWGEEDKKKHLAKMEGVAKERNVAMQRIKAEQNKVLKTIFDKYQPVLKAVVDKYMEEKNIDLMIKREAVAAALNDSIDVTQDIATELDKQK